MCQLVALSIAQKCLQLLIFSSLEAYDSLILIASLLLRMSFKLDLGMITANLAMVKLSTTRIEGYNGAIAPGLTLTRPMLRI